MSSLAGEKCQSSGCSGHYVTYKSIAGIEYRKRLLRCNICHHRPENNILTVPIAYAPRRQPRRRIFDKTENRIF
jgi:hypothetical protein